MCSGPTQHTTQSRSGSRPVGSRGIRLNSSRSLHRPAATDLVNRYRSCTRSLGRSREARSRAPRAPGSRSSDAQAPRGEPSRPGPAQLCQQLLIERTTQQLKLPLRHQRRRFARRGHRRAHRSLSRCGRRRTAPPCCGRPLAGAPRTGARTHRRSMVTLPEQHLRGVDPLGCAHAVPALWRSIRGCTGRSSDAHADNDRNSLCTRETFIGAPSGSPHRFTKTKSQPAAAAHASRSRRR